MIRKGSAILPLDPFLDQEGILRVGGRLSNATALEYEAHFVLNVHFPRCYVQVHYLIVDNYFRVIRFALYIFQSLRGFKCKWNKLNDPH